MANSRAWKEASAGTYVDKQAPRVIAGVFCALALVALLVPLVGMIWARTDSTTENHELAAFPNLTNEDGSANVDLLQDLGAYFDDHFAYRNQAVTANAALRAALGTSATDQVVVGTDGWLYYGGTLPDYLGQSTLSDRSLASIAHNLSLAQGYVESRGAAFAFTLAPNKNTLDATHMPYYYLRYEGPSNAERLKPYLANAGVNYVDLFSVLSAEKESSGEFGYMKLDSHWNNRWALLGANSLLAALGRDPLPIDPGSAVNRTDFEGDLQSMLYPAATQLEENSYYAGYNDGENATGVFWRYEEGSDVTEDWIRTSAMQGIGTPPSEGSLLMFRDSFGNALLPYVAPMFQNAAFSKLVPYNFTQVAQLEATAVIVERAERHLFYLASNPPIMSSPRCALPESAKPCDADIEIEADGPFWVVRGTLANDSASPETPLYVRVSAPGADPVTFNPFWTSEITDDGHEVSARGFLLYIPSSAVDVSQAEIETFTR